MLMYAFVEQGSMHRFMHHHAQDYAVSHRRGSVGGVAVSDGAGSKPLSADGAHIVAHDVIRHMVDHFDTLFQMGNEAVSRRLARLIERDHNAKRAVSILVGINTSATDHQIRDLFGQNGA